MRDRVIGNSFEDVRHNATMALKIEVEDGRGGVATARRVETDFVKVLKDCVSVCLGLLLLDENGILYFEEDIGVGFSGGGRSKTVVEDYYTAMVGYYY
ncbi:hypothetical protein HN51_014833 [Arachis hypogaea]